MYRGTQQAKTPLPTLLWTARSIPYVLHLFESSAVDVSSHLRYLEEVDRFLQYLPQPPLAPRQQVSLARGAEGEGSLCKLGAATGGGTRPYQHGGASAREDQKKTQLRVLVRNRD